MMCDLQWHMAIDLCMAGVHSMLKVQSTWRGWLMVMASHGSSRVGGGGGSKDKAAVQAAVKIKARRVQSVEGGLRSTS